MSELLPCPFCGKPATESWGRDNEVVNIRCSNWRSNVCLGAGPNSYNLDEAIAAWNRRAQPSSEPVARAATSEEGAVEALRRDAARYRWLRNEIVKGPLTIATADSWELHPWSGDCPDAAIDAAMAEHGGHSDG